MIPDTVIEEIRTRIDPVEVIGRRLELRKTGTSFSASCPFHSDRTPSFRVYPDSKRFKCFGCGARGDAFEFLQRFEGKDFRTVVQELATEAGVVIADADGSNSARCGATSLPTTYVVDADGVIRGHGMRGGYLVDRVDEALAGPAAPR